MRTLRFDSLQVCVYPDRIGMGSAAARSAAQIIRRASDRGEAQVIFACAPSQNEFLDGLVERALDWSSIVAFHMDEYVGLDAAHPQSFRRYLQEHLFARVGKPKAFHGIHGEAQDLEEECIRYGAQLAAREPIDLVCMGIGENGHLAFNDPPVADFRDPQFVKIVALDETCRQQQVNDGCFPTLDAVPTQALTLTIPALLFAPEISCVVPGERKAAAVRDALLGPISTSCPASILRTHPRAVLHIDEAAASLLPK